MNVHIPTRFVNEHGDVGTLYKTMSLEDAIKGGHVVGLSMTGELILPEAEELRQEWLEEQRLKASVEFVEGVRLGRGVWA